MPALQGKMTDVFAGLGPLQFLQMLDLSDCAGLAGPLVPPAPEQQDSGLCLLATRLNVLNLAEIGEHSCWLVVCCGLPQQTPGLSVQCPSRRQAVSVAAAARRRRRQQRRRRARCTQVPLPSGVLQGCRTRTSRGACWTAPAPCRSCAWVSSGTTTASALVVACAGRVGIHAEADSLAVSAAQMPACSQSRSAGASLLITMA